MKAMTSSRLFAATSISRSRPCAVCWSTESRRARRSRFRARRDRPDGAATFDSTAGEQDWRSLLLCLVCGQPCRATQATLPTASWPPGEVPTKVCRGTPYVTAEGNGSQAWGIHYG